MIAILAILKTDKTWDEVRVESELDSAIGKFIALFEGEFPNEVRTVFVLKWIPNEHVETYAHIETIGSWRARYWKNRNTLIKKILLDHPAIKEAEVSGSGEAMIILTPGRIATPKGIIAWTEEKGCSPTSVKILV